MPEAVLWLLPEPALKLTLETFPLPEFPHYREERDRHALGPTAGRGAASPRFASVKHHVEFSAALL